MNAKPWWQSKTLWFNIAVSVADLIAAVLHDIPPQYAGTIGALTAINFGLRAITTQPLK